MLFLLMLMSYLSSNDTTKIYSNDPLIQNWISNQRYYALQNDTASSKEIDTVFYVVRNTYEEIKISNEIEKYRNINKYIGGGLITAGVFSFSLSPNDVYERNSSSKFVYTLFGISLILIGVYEISF